MADIKEDYLDFRDKFLSRGRKKEYLTIEQARANKWKLDWKDFKSFEPNKLGIQIIKGYDIAKLVEYIDWSPFFRSWDLHGRYPEILEDDIVGAQARELFADAKVILKKMIDEKLIEARAIYGLFEANTINDDDIEFRDPSGKKGIFRTLRQQSKKAEGRPNIALSDFIAPKETGKKDYIGCFCVSTGFGAEEWAQDYKDNLDDYNSIMVKALADRFAEAFAEFLHKKVRKEDWGYAVNEDLDNTELIRENYLGIRPAPGYPACPDHLEKLTIWEVLNVEESIGVKLTESLAMWPAASVSGYYFGNPEARYFGLGKIKEDQVADFAKRKNIEFPVAEKWLNPNIADD